MNAYHRLIQYLNLEVPKPQADCSGPPDIPHYLAMLLPAVIWLGLPGEAAAQIFFVTYSWTDPNGGSYNDSGNWQPDLGFGGIPDSDSEGARFDLNATYEVDFPTDVSTNSAGVIDGTVTWNLDSSGTARTYTLITLTVSGASDPTLVIQDGTVNAGTVRVLDTGFLDINADFGGDSILNVSGNVEIDGGRLRKLGGDQFNLSPGGQVTVSNGGLFDHVNRYHLQQGNTFSVDSGGGMEFSSLDIAGTGASGDGTLTVDGAGSSVLSNFAVSPQIWGANGHNAIIEVSNGGRVDIDSEDLLLANDGSAATATITVDGQDAVFAHADGGAQIIIGHATSGSAVINVRHGGLFTAAAGSAGNGRVIVNPTGEMHLESGGVFDARSIEMNGGSIDLSGGTLRFISFSGNLVNSAGTLDPGHQVGFASMDGNYTQQDAASMLIEIAGVLPGQADTLTVAGNAILDGTLRLSVIDGFVPVIGNSFTILQTQFGNVGGTFDTLDFPVINGLTFDVTYNPQSVALGVVAAPAHPADLDGDGDVDVDDLALFEDCATGPEVRYDPDNLPVGCTLTLDPDGILPIDFDSDRDGDQSDFAVLQRCYSGEGNLADPTCAD